MVKKRLLFVEGASNTGKATLCGRLEKDYGFAIVHEAARYLEKEFMMPCERIMSPPSSLEEERYNQNLLFHAECQRLDDAVAWLEEGKEVIYDRTPFMILAVAHAFKCYEGYFGDPWYACEKLRDLLTHYGEYLKDVELRCVLLSAGKRTRLIRNGMRSRKLQKVWTQDEIVQKQESCCRHILNGLGIDWIELDSSKGEVLNDVVSFYNK